MTWFDAENGERVNDAAVRADFEAFARDNWSTLMSIGLAVAGSRAEAEDLVQTALTNAYVRWRWIRRTRRRPTCADPSSTRT